MNEEHDAATFDDMPVVVAPRAPLPSAKKAAILDAAKAARRTVRVDLPGVGCSALLREMSGKDHDSYNESLRVRDGVDEDTHQVLYAQTWLNARAKLIARCWVDEDTSERMFTDAEADQVGNLPTSDITTAFEACMRVNGMSEQDIADVVGNSEATLGGDS